MYSKPLTEAVVLAGGIGSRLSPITKYRPKPLVPIGNYSMLDWNFFMLASNGIKRAIVVVNYLGDQIREHIKNFTSKIHPDMEIVIPEVDSSYGTADALRVVSDQIISENFFVTMADIVTNIDLKKMGLYHVKKGGIATISIKPTSNDPRQFGVILLDERGKVLRFLEKPSLEELCLTKLIVHRSQSFNYHTNLINSGIYCFKRPILEILNEFDLKDFGKNVFPYLLKSKLGIYGFKSEHEYYWRDCGCPDQLLWTNLEILKQGNFPYCPKDSRSDDKFDKNIILIEPLAIGNHVQIKTGTRIHLTSINDECTIGKNCKITRSLIWENVKIGNNVSIKDSIISDNVTIGDNCSIVEETIIPSGYTIPPNSYIKKGLVISDDSSDSYLENVLY